MSLKLGCDFPNYPEYKGGLGFVGVYSHLSKSAAATERLSERLCGTFVAGRILKLNRFHPELAWLCVSDFDMLERLLATPEAS